MTLEEIGIALRTERERRGISIEEVELKLRIGSRILRAMEEGDKATLPHKAYTKGFLRAYCTFLGLSPDEVSAAVACFDDQPSAVDSALMESIECESRWLPKLAVLVLLLAVVGGAFFLWHRGVLEPLKPKDLMQPSAPVADATADKASQKRLPVGEEKSRKASRAAQQPSPPRPSQPAAPSAEAPTQGARSQASQDPQWVLPPSVSQPPPQEAAPATAETRNTVIVRATEECWIRSKADDTDVRQMALRKGDTFLLTFTKKLEVRLGNAGGVRIRYNGEELPPPGQPGQVKTLVFPPPAAER
jgi:cytoskeleton protein RodZ